jgi:uncharacterized protein YjiS (DUF1127 family)
VNVIVRKIVEVLQYAAKNRAATELLTLSNEQLKDIGISRAKLYKGASAYPWKIETAAVLNFTQNQPTAQTTVMDERDSVAA